MKATKPKPQPRFWIIDTESPGEHQRSRTAIGPFPNQKAAEQWLREDAEENYLTSSPDLREEWDCAPMIIVEERRTVVQKPTITVKVSLVTAI